MTSRATDLPLKPHNTSQAVPTAFPFHFSIPPNTDLWLKPPPLDAPPSIPPHIATTQPTFYSTVRFESLIRAKTVVSFVPEQLYDQAGLVILFPNDSGKWIKAGVEYVDEQGKRSVVVATGGGQGADWSVSPPLVSGVYGNSVGSTVEFEREEEGRGTSLLIKIDGEIVREVTWVFAASQEDSGKEDIWVGFYGARPATGDVGNLDVLVEAWELGTSTSL